MTVLAIISTNITDSAWIAEYTEKVTPMVSKVGGRYLTRTDKVDLIEGAEKPQFSIVVEFPSKEVATAFYESKEYRPYRDARQQGSSSQFLLVAVENGTS